MPLLFRGVTDETVSAETVPTAETVLFRGVTDETVSVYGDSANNDPTVHCHTQKNKSQGALKRANPASSSKRHNSKQAKYRCLGCEPSLLIV